MAHDFSSTYASQVAFPHLAHLHILIALYKPIRIVRRWLRSLDSKSAASSCSSTPTLSAQFDAASEHFKQKHWAYIKDIFPSELHRSLVAQFPKRRYMEPPKSIYKSYDIGFKWERGRGGAKYIDQHQCYKGLLEYFCSDEFSNRLTALSGSDAKLVCRSFLVNRTYPGTLVIPHKDDPIPREYTPYINMVFFLDGTGGPDSGELILARDNAYQEIEFAPDSVKNACLMYDTEAPFYHGFKPVAFGKYRLALIASFARADYIPKH